MATLPFSLQPKTMFRLLIRFEFFVMFFIWKFGYFKNSDQNLQDKVVWKYWSIDKTRLNNNIIHGCSSKLD